MIYLLDMPLTDISHSKYMCDIIKNHTSEPIIIIPLNANSTYGDIAKTIYSLFDKVIPSDIVLCSWAVPANNDLDDLFTELSKLCYVIAAAGNFKEPIENYTPARSEGVITVGTLNKSGLVAALSNYSNSKEVVWIPGTNYNVGWTNGSGTSVSAAVYTAFLAEALKNKDMSLLDKLVTEHKNKVFSELN
jgi:hypothetical protein